MTIRSIYGWRGAEVENILRFERDFPGAKVIRLERNYRSTPAILGAASGLIAANKGRLGKTLWTEGDAGEKINVHGRVGRGRGSPQCRRRRRRPAPPGPSLRRRWRCWCAPRSRCANLKTALFRLGLPYRVIGGPRFYERAEIRDAMAYLRLIAQGDDDLAFERIVNKPKRGIGDASVATLHAFARARGLAASGGGARDRRDRRIAAQGAQGAGRTGRAISRAGARRAQGAAAYRTGRNGAGRKRLYRHAEGRQIGGSAGPARQPQGIRPLDGGVRIACSASWSMCRW